MPRCLSHFRDDWVGDSCQNSFELTHHGVAELCLDNSAYAIGKETLIPAVLKAELASWVVVAVVVTIHG